MTSYLTEDSNFEHEVGCLMVTFDLPKWEAFIRKVVKPEDLQPVDWDEDGLEDDAHVTLLYGFSPDVTVEKLKPMLMPLEDINVTFSKIDSFSNPDFDVLKFNAKSDQLSQLRPVIKTLPHYEKYPEFNPHMTIAYLKTGTAEKYVKELTVPFDLKPKEYYYSYPDGRREFFII